MAGLMLIPSQGAYVSGAAPDEVLPGRSTLAAGLDYNNAVYRTFLYFDLCSLPQNIVLESAILRLYTARSRMRSIRGGFTPYALISEWKESEVTWNGQPRYNPSVAGKSQEIAAFGWQSWDVTNLFKMWLLDPECNFGLVLKSTEDRKGDLRRFYSYASVYTAYRPYVEIRFSYKNATILGGRSTTNSYESVHSSDDMRSSSWQNTSQYSMYTFFVQNNGSHPAQVTAQISPDGHVAVDDGAMFTIAPGEVEAIVAQRYAFFTRIAYKSCFYGCSTRLRIWFQAQI